MGALHAGHLSLIQRARQENDWVVVSIFVNPLQFGPGEDFQRYPRTLEADCALCEAAGVNVVFAPHPTELYPLRTDSLYAVSPPPASTAFTHIVPPAPLTAVLCGPFRPGHFEGVATVVVKLFNVVQPQRAYFGQKDAQQLAVVRRVVADLNLSVDVVACSTVREPDGLAMSSRNRYLSPEERSQATVLYRGLQKAERLFSQGIDNRQSLIHAVETELGSVPNLQLEYLDLVHPMTMQPLESIDESGLLAIAARLGSTRLIDNVVLRNRRPIVAIDGPAGAGKSTVVRRAAQELGLLYLDTGAMYRAVTWLVLQSGMDLEDQAAIAELVSQCEIRLEEGRPAAEATVTGSQTGSAGEWSGDPVPASPAMPSVWINGQNVTQSIRSPEVTASVSAVAAQAAVRRVLMQQQQAYGRRGGIMMDGRDIGTYVFPDAELKIFLTASVQERARRRQQDLINQGQHPPSLAELEELIYQRDLKDSTRAIAPLRKAADAIEIQTDGLTIEEVTDRIVTLYRERLNPSLVG